MDQICRRLVDDATDAFIASIDRSKICDLASNFHPERKPCRVFCEPMKGSYNICFPIVFFSGEGVTDEKWVIRIPLTPRLAFPEEKMRSEIATMKYIASNTSIPIPHIYGYGFSQTHPLGLTFMLISYIPGQDLSKFDLANLDRTRRSQLYAHLADIFIQLRHCEFPHIGSLTLDPTDDQTPIFVRNCPLSIDINDHEVGGLNATSIVSPSRIYTTAIDYIYSLTQLLFNQFDKQQNSVYNEKDARYHLYGLHQFRSIVIGWLQSETNEGRFILNHGDLRRSNIRVDSDMNITGVLDWEWSRTVPKQMFVPPAWLTGSDIRGLLGFSGILYMRELAIFRDVLKAREGVIHCHGSSGEEIPLSKLWKGIHKHANFFIAHALLRLDVAGDVYWEGLDRHYFGKDAEARVKLFYEVTATADQNRVIARKLRDLGTYNAKLRERGLAEDRPPEPPPGLPADKAQQLATLLQNIDNDLEVKKHVLWSWPWFRSRMTLYWSNSVSPVSLSQIAIGITLISGLSYTLSRHR